MPRPAVEAGGGTISCWGGSPTCRPSGPTRSRGPSSPAPTSGPGASRSSRSRSRSFYTGGMYLNDAFDREIDARERPERPIPSGRVTAPMVFAIGFGLLGAGVAAVGRRRGRVGRRRPRRPCLSGVLLAGAIMLYDAWHKANPLSPLVMGLCRVLVYVTAALAVAGRVGARGLGRRRRAPLLPDRPHLRGQAGEPRPSSATSGRSRSWPRPSSTRGRRSSPPASPPSLLSGLPGVGGVRGGRAWSDRVGGTSAARS